MFGIQTYARTNFGRTDLTEYCIYVM